MYEDDSINKVTRPLMCVMFFISFKFPARSEQVELCFLSRTLDHTSYQSYCPYISCKILGLVETWSNSEGRSVIRFLRLKGTSPAEIHRQLLRCTVLTSCHGNTFGFGALHLIKAGQTFKMSSNLAGQARPPQMTMCAALKV
jgi:hypothetical protein